MFPYPELFLVQTLWRPLCLALAGTLVFSGLFSLFSDATERANAFLSNIVIAFSFSAPVIFLAFVSGYLTGVSRNGVVGSILPAVLSLIGGIVVYIFGTESRYKIVIGYCVFMFPVSLLYGAQTGALERQVGREGFVKTLSEQERRIRNFRLNLDLPEDPPGWVVPKDDK